MDYKNGKIYKIVSDETDKIYIGSTCTPLYKRLYEHKSTSNSYQNGKSHYVTSSYELISLGNVDIVLIENYPCKDKNELHARERYWIEKNKDIIVNKALPTRTNKEWCEDNKDKLKEYMKEYREDNKDKLKEQGKEYQEDNNKAIKKYKKQFYENNKDKIKEHLGKIGQCECGIQYTYGHISRHLKSVKHQQYINEQKDKIRLPQYAYDKTQILICVSQ